MFGPQRYEILLDFCYLCKLIGIICAHDGHGQRKTMKRMAVIWLCGLLLCSCEFFSGVIHDGKVVAKAGSHKLYSSELEQYIPSGLSPEDSTRLAMQYTNSWAADQLYLDLAEKELSKQERDVSRELEDYRRSLLKYRYEQAYVNQRLDTAITTEQIEAYFEAHKEQFTLRVPIVKARFMSFSADSPQLTEVRKKLASKKAAQLIEADSLAFSTALRYTDYGGAWVDAVTLAGEFGTDYMTLISGIKEGCFEMDGAGGEVSLAVISDLMKAGQTGPVEYYTERIKDILLSARKQQLLSTLEKDMLSRARAGDEFVIY